LDADHHVCADGAVRSSGGDGVRLHSAESCRFCTVRRLSGCRSAGVTRLGREITLSKTVPARHGLLASWLRDRLAHRLARGVDLDSAEATALHARLIREKPFLRQLYSHYYDQYEAAVARATPGGIVLEVGAGAGFYRQVRPSVVSLDLRPGAQVDLIGSALSIPLRAASTSAVLLLNVLHHLPDPAAFFRECERVLKPGGRVCLIEPYAGPLSRRLIRPLHHEPWNEAGGWTLPPSGPLTGANMALPSIIFRRDLSRYQTEFPHLPVDRFRLHTIVLYLLSGGVSMRSFAPGAAFMPMLALERLLAPAGRLLASMMTVELVKH
jgi:SAM-dependent methyltransferase